MEGQPNEVGYYGPQPETANNQTLSSSKRKGRKTRWTHQQKRERKQQRALQQQQQQQQQQPLQSDSAFLIPSSVIDASTFVQNNNNTRGPQPPFFPQHQHQQRQQPRRRHANKSMKRKLVDCAQSAAHTHCVQVHSPPEGYNNHNHNDTVRVVTSSDFVTANSFLQQNHNMRNSAASTTVVVVKPLLILDLNGILCHRIRANRPEAYPGIPYRTPLSRPIAQTRIVPRIHLDWFLHSLEGHFTLAVWTSAKSSTAQKLLSQLLPPSLIPKLLFVWNQHHCTRQSPPASQDNNNNHHNKTNRPIPIFSKPLDRVWSSFPLWNSSNTLLMDDSTEKCPLVYRANTLHPPPLHGKDLPATPETQMVPSTCDEYNETIQHEFFQQVAQHFAKPRETLHCHNNNNNNNNTTTTAHQVSHEMLMEFLSNNHNACGHMGWRGPSSSSF